MYHIRFSALQEEINFEKVVEDPTFLDKGVSNDVSEADGVNVVELCQTLDTSKVDRRWDIDNGFINEFFLDI